MDDIQKFSYLESELLNNTYNNNFINLMSHESKIAKSYFEKADNELRTEDKKSLFAARAMQHIYFRLLKKIERKNFDVFNKDINVSNFEKVFLALGVWAKYRIVY